MVEPKVAEGVGELYETLLLVDFEATAGKRKSKTVLMCTKRGVRT